MPYTVMIRDISQAQTQTIKKDTFTDEERLQAERRYRSYAFSKRPNEHVELYKNTTRTKIKR